MLYVGCNITRSVAQHYFKVLCMYSQLKLSSKAKNFIETTEGTDKKKKKTSIIPKITLIAQDDNISITTLEDAEKLSKRRELKLVKIIDFDLKTQRPVYKLMTGAEYLSEELKQRVQRKAERANNSGIKGEKVLILTSNIAEHDIKVNINKILKWITKQYEVRIVINGTATNMEKAEGVYKFLENQIGNDGRIVQKRTKGNDIKLQVLPLKKNKENKENLQNS